MHLSINQLFTSQQFAFSKLLAFRVHMLLAYQIMAVVAGWHIYELTHDPLALGLIGLAEVIICGPRCRSLLLKTIFCHFVFYCFMPWCFGSHRDCHGHGRG